MSLTFAPTTIILAVSASVVNTRSTTNTMQTEQTEGNAAQPVQPLPVTGDASGHDETVSGDQVAGDKIEGDSIVANLDNVNGSTVIIGKNIHATPAAPGDNEARTAPPHAQMGVSVRVDNSTLTSSSINIQQGRVEKTADPAFIQNKTVQGRAHGLELTQHEGKIRRLYRALLRLEDSQLFSTDTEERAELQDQIEQQVQDLRRLLSPYLAQARQTSWLIPPDVQAACDRSGVAG